MHSESNDRCENCAARKTASGNRHNSVVDCVVQVEGQRSKRWQSVGDCFFYK